MHAALTNTLDEINTDSRHFGIGLVIAVVLFGVLGVSKARQKSAPKKRA